MSTASVTTRVDGRYAGERRIRQRTARRNDGDREHDAGRDERPDVRAARPSPSAAASMSRTAR